MKGILPIIICGVIMLACQDQALNDSEFTGNEMTYALMPGSSYQVSGTVTFKEKKNGSALVRVALTGTEGSVQHPVHLHLGNVTTADSEVAALLNPVTGSTGLSETILSRLADESAVTYKQLVELDASVKIHLAASGPDKNIILAAGNIGVATSTDLTGGRTGVAVCK